MAFVNGISQIFSLNGARQIVFLGLDRVETHRSGPSIQTRLGVTTIMVTHDQEEA